MNAILCLYEVVLSVKWNEDTFIMVSKFKLLD